MVALNNGINQSEPIIEQIIVIQSNNAGVHTDWVALVKYSFVLLSQSLLMNSRTPLINGIKQLRSLIF